MFPILTGKNIVCELSVFFLLVLFKYTIIKMIWCCHQIILIIRKRVAKVVNKENKKQLHFACVDNIIILQNCQAYYVKTP